METWKHGEMEIWKHGGMGTDLLQTVIVDQLWTVTMNEGTECQPILETEQQEREGGEKRERERERRKVRERQEDRGGGIWC